MSYNFAVTFSKDVTFFIINHNTMNTSELTTYQKHFSERGFWNKISKVAVNLGRKTLFYALVLYYVLKSPDVSLGNKAIIMGALGYLILPVDLIPDFVPGLGLTDDAAAIKLAYDTVKASVTPEIISKAEQRVYSLLS